MGMNSTPGPGAARVDELDGLRGLLALWVAVSHMVCLCGLHAVALPGSLTHAWIEFAYAEPAVECFIILSGFAISYLLASRPQPYRAYLTARFFRIYPVYLVCLLLALGTVFITPYVLSLPTWHDNIYLSWVVGHAYNTQMNVGTHLFMHATLLHGLPTRELLPDSASAILGPAWSITLEWQYYLVAPLIARGVKSTTGILVLCAIAWLGLRFGSRWENGHLAFLPGQLPLFLIGIASYHLYAWFRSVQMECTHTKNVLVAVFLGSAIVLHWHRTAIVIWAVVFGCILASGPDRLTRILSVVRRFLLLSWLQKLGQVSYSLYLLHFPLIIVLLYGLMLVAPAISAPNALLAMLAIGLPVVLGLTVLLHRVVELPGMRLGRDLSRRLE